LSGSLTGTILVRRDFAINDEFLQIGRPSVLWILDRSGHVYLGTLHLPTKPFESFRSTGFALLTFRHRFRIHLERVVLVGLTKFEQKGKKGITMEL
jgi:hypothetical protein